MSGKRVLVRDDQGYHKEKMKEMGGKWNASQKSWVCDSCKLQELLNYFKLSTDSIGLEVIQEANNNKQSNTKKRQNFM